MRTFIAGALLLTAGLVAAGCYSFTGSSVPPHLKTVAIPLFEDQSGFAEPGMKERLTQKVIDLFVSDNSLQVADKGTADCIIEGTIVGVTDAPSTIQPGEVVAARRVTMSVHVVFQDLRLRKKVWEKDFSDWGDYAPGTAQRSTAIDEAIRKISENILIETVSGW